MWADKLDVGHHFDGEMTMAQPQEGACGRAAGRGSRRSEAGASLTVHIGSEAATSGPTMPSTLTRREEGVAPKAELHAKTVTHAWHRSMGDRASQRKWAYPPHPRA
jgi:hypothetical protein